MLKPGAMQSTLRLWQLISPALPIGSFSYSQGLEYAIDSGALKTEADVEHWLKQQLEAGLGRLDVPMLFRLMTAWEMHDEIKLHELNASLLAYRESAELLMEDKQVGYALARLLTDLGIGEAESWQQGSSYITLFALVCYKWQIAPQDAAAGLLWAWVENMVAAAVKLLPMGQTSGQKMLIKLADQIEKVVLTAMTIEDDEIGSLLPAVAMASAWHETQYSRLFRS